MEFDDDDLELLGYGQQRAIEAVAALVVRRKIEASTEFSKLSGAERSNRKRLTREWRARNPERVYAAKRRWLATDSGKSKSSATRRRYYARNRDAISARGKARRAAAKAAKPPRPIPPPDERPKYYETRRRWREANREKIREHARAYYLRKKSTKEPA